MTEILTKIHIVAMSAFLLLVVSCGGRQSGVENPPSTAPTTATSEDAQKPDLPKPQPQPAEQTPVDINTEIVPLLAPIPRPLSDGDRLPEDPALIRERASQLTKEGNFEEALPLIDVLLILEPNDYEMLEVRGRILLEQGLVEDATVDLNRCCSKGRDSCCR